MTFGRTELRIKAAETKFDEGVDFEVDLAAASRTPRPEFPNLYTRPKLTSSTLLLKEPSRTFSRDFRELFEYVSQRLALETIQKGFGRIQNFAKTVQNDAMGIRYRPGMASGLLRGKIVFELKHNEIKRHASPVFRLQSMSCNLCIWA